MELDGRAIIASELAGLYRWRKHKIVYNFDPTLAEELVAQAENMTEDDTIPTDILLNPLYPCVFIQTDKPLDGETVPFRFLTWIEEDANSHVRKFRVQVFSDDMENTNSFTIELTQPTLYGCIYDTLKTTAKYEQKKVYRPRQTGQPIKDKFREIDMQDVGVVIGHTLRRARMETEQAGRDHASEESGAPKQGSHKRPHTRRGHWHHYWIGSKSEPTQRKLILKWTHPMLIGKPVDNVVTIIPVKE